MRNAASTRPHPPVAGRLSVTIASAVVAYALLVLTCAMSLERLLESTPPEIVAGIAQSAATGWFPP